MHDSKVVQTAFNFINSDASGNSALQRTYREVWAPGSTFKVVTAKSAIETGTATPDTNFDSVTNYVIPGTTTPLFNFDQEFCGGSLVESLVNSCNTTFAKLGYDMGPAFVPQMDECGIHSAIPIDLSPGSAVSTGPTVDSEKPRFALAGIGQGEVATTPLQMAVIAAAVANGGVIKEPHVMQEIQDSQGQTLETFEPKDWRTCMSSNTAAALNQMMQQVVRARHRHPGPDRRREGGRQDRHRAVGAGQGSPRVVHRLRPGRQPAVRGGGGRAQRRPQQRRDRHRRHRRRPDRQAGPAGAPRPAEALTTG